MSQHPYNRRQFLSGLSRTVLALGALPNLTVNCSKPQQPDGEGLETGTTGYVYDDRFLEHYHSTEMAQRLVTIQQHMADTGLAKEVTNLSFVHEPIPFIKAVHSQEHIDGIRKLPRTWPAAELAVAGVLGAVKAVCEGRVKNAFCAVRPPGHHAHNLGAEEGFCFYGNAAITARYAQSAFSLQRVLIIDWDYHHGNGTEWAFYDDPSVLFFSTHDWPAYPGTGDPGRRGEGTGLGYNINVHLDCGAGDDAIFQAFDEVLVPAADEFKPELVLISAGFDSKRNDLLGCFDITPCGFSRITRKAMDIAEAHCGGRLVSLLEGGYADRDNPSADTFNGLALSAAAHVGTLLTGDLQSCAGISN
ncbi:histone deacetylase [Fibrobacterota bacterium]